MGAIGTLGGIGTISKNITVNGTLAPGNGIGTLNVIGNVVLASGSTHENELNPSVSDLVNVTGTYSIQPGATLSILPEVANYPEPFTYPIILTTGGVSGTYSNVTSPLPLLASSLTYNLNSIFLQILFEPITSLSFSGNAGKITHCLDSFPLIPGTDTGFVIEQLRFIDSVEELEKALLQLQPSAFTSLATATQENTLGYTRSLTYRLFNCTPTRTLTTWIAPLRSETSLLNKGFEPGFRATAPGISMGINYLFHPNLWTGIALGYMNTDLNWRLNRGDATINSYYLSLLGKYQKKTFFIEGVLGFSLSDFDVTRKIKFQSTAEGINRRAKSSHLGYEGSIHLKSGLHFQVQTYSLIPFLSVDYLNLYESSFKEHGAQSLNLNIDSKNTGLLAPELGIEVNSTLNRSSGTVVPYIQLSVLQESRLYGKTERSTIQGGCSIDVDGQFPQKTFGVVTAGLKVCRLPEDFSLSLQYTGKFAKHFHNQSGSVSLAKNF